VLSALVVDGRGTPLELGERVVKNVAGYDLLRLHFGAGGSLGAISDLLLRVRARPASRASRLLHVEPEACIDALMSVRRAAPSASSCEFYLSEGLLSLWGEQGRGAWLCFEEGAAAGVRAWEEAVGGEGCSRGPVELDEIGLESDPDGCTLEFYLSARAALERHHDLDRCCRWWWLDAGRGILRASVPSSRQRELRRSLPGPAYLVAGRLDHEASATNATVDTWMRRLRRAFDPAEIFPPAPRPLP
jgi:FAD/FMN-containing dehydrogenase